MDEGHVRVGSTIQTNRKQNVSSIEDEAYGSLCDCENAQVSQPV